jgi:hypothetical protein
LHKLVTRQARIILVNGSRLLRELLLAVIHKAEHLAVVKDIPSNDKLPAALEAVEADWLLVSLPSDKELPDWVDQHMSRHPLVRCLAVSTSSGRVILRWLEPHEEAIDNLSLDELLQILECYPGLGPRGHEIDPMERVRQLQESPQ